MGGAAGLLQLELGGGGGCCLRSLKRRAMDGLEGETRGDAAAGLELARTSRPGVRGQVRPADSAARSPRSPTPGAELDGPFRER